MDRSELLRIRHYLGKTQIQMARLLGCSLKAVQSFEQGWRKIPSYIERQALFFVHKKKLPQDRYKPCWEIENCDPALKQLCPAREFHAGHLCWFINGTICQGKIQDNWQKKMKMCRQCKVFRVMLPVLFEDVSNEEK
jgi:DNA-binding XRE family transcriptional regulator